MAVHVFLMLAKRPAPEPKVVMAATLDALRERGCTVEVGYEESLYDLAHLPVADIYLVKSRSPYWHSLATALHYLGRPLVNSFDAIQKTQDKVVAAALLARGGVPVPPGWTTDSPLALAPLLERGEVVIKPRLGHRGAGIRWLKVAHDLDDLCLAGDVHLIQQSLPVEGPDLKVYGIGERLFAFRKRYASGVHTQVGDQVELDAKSREIVLACREILGLDLYGVDIVQAEGRPYVVDVNLYPGFRGIPEAPGLTAEQVLAALRRR